MKRSKKLIVSILAIVMLVCLAGFGYGSSFTKSATESLTVIVTNEGASVSGLDAKLVFEKSDVSLRPEQEEEPVQEEPVEEEPVQEEPVQEVPKDISLDFDSKEQCIKLSNKDMKADTVKAAIDEAVDNDYIPYVVITNATATATDVEYYPITSELKVKLGVETDEKDPDKIHIVTEDEISLTFSKVPVATVNFVGDISARDGNSLKAVTGYKVTSKDENTLTIGSVKKTAEGLGTDAIELANGFEYHVVIVGSETKYESISAALANIVDGDEVNVVIEKTDNNAPTFNASVSGDYLTISNVTDDVSKSEDITVKVVANNKEVRAEKDGTYKIGNNIATVTVTDEAGNERTQSIGKVMTVTPSLAIKEDGSPDFTTALITVNFTSSLEAYTEDIFGDLKGTKTYNTEYKVILKSSKATKPIVSSEVIKLDKNNSRVTPDDIVFSVVKTEFDPEAKYSVELQWRHDEEYWVGFQLITKTTSWSTVNVSPVSLDIDVVAPSIAPNETNLGCKNAVTIGGAGNTISVTDGTAASNVSGVNKIYYCAYTETTKDVNTGTDEEPVYKEQQVKEYLSECEAAEDHFAEIAGNGVVELKFGEKNGTWIIEVKAEDNAENVCDVKTFTVCLDTEPPQIDTDNLSYAPALNTNNFVNGEVTVSIPVSDLNGIDRESGTISFTKDGTASGNVTCSVEDNVLKYTLSGDGVYSITGASVKDIAGNEAKATVSGQSFTIDTKDPVIDKVEFKCEAEVWNEKYYSDVRTAEITVTDANLEKGTVTIVKDNDTANPIEIAIDKDGKLAATEREDITTKGNVISFNEDGVYQITEVYVVDLAGHELTETDAAVLGDEFVIDLTAPVIADVEYVSDVDAGEDNQFKAVRTAEITVTDANTVEGSNLFNGTVTIVKNNDTANPIEIAIDKDGKLAATEREDITTKGNVISFNEDGVYQITEIVVNDKAGNTTTATQKGTTASTKEERAAVLGAEFVIDLTAPVIDNVEFECKAKVWNEKYYSEVRHATIKGSDDNTVDGNNFSSGSVTYTEVFNAADKAAGRNITTKSVAIKADGNTLTAEIEFKDNYIYEITQIEIIDKAGNKTTVTADKVEVSTGEKRDKADLGGEFVVDLENPKSSVSYTEEHGPANDKYYNVCRTATLTVNEHNFDNRIFTFQNGDFEDAFKAHNYASGVYVKIIPVKGDAETQNIKEFAFPTSGWVDNGDAHVLTVSYDGNNAYLFETCVIDMSGRDEYNRKSGEIDTDHEFTVDKDIVAPQISGVNEGAAYNGDCVPVITFSDANFLEGTVHIFRTRDGIINHDVTDIFATGLVAGENGGTITLGTFEKLPTNDGIYTIVANMSDKAGNTAESRVTFSLNRFGSVYKLGDSLASVRGQHVQTVDGDFTITEINPDTLVDGSLKVTITRNGKPIDSIFDVKPGTASPSIGQSGWYEYVYTIAAKNFEEDGFYTVTVSSTDEVGNNSSTTSYDECTMEFWVDDTNAEFTGLTGLEKAIINAKTAPVDFKVYDEIGISKIQVFCNDIVIASFEGDAIQDINNFEGKFEVPEGRNQTIRIVVTDLSGNVTDTEQLIADNELPEFMENIKDITVSTNFFVRWFANKLVFFGSLVGIIALGSAAWWFLIGKKRKDEDEVEEESAAK